MKKILNLSLNKIIGLTVLGIIIGLSGFVYDVLFAGIPYQDPTPEMTEKFNFHKSVAGVIYTVGASVFLVGLLATLIILAKKKKN